METLTGVERISKTLQLQEPDRVPHFELDIHPKVSEKILPGSSYDERVEYFNWDAVGMDDRHLPGWRVEALDASGKYFRSQWGTIVRVTSEQLTHPVEGVIKSEKENSLQMEVNEKGVYRTEVYLFVGNPFGIQKNAVWIGSNPIYIQ